VRVVLDIALRRSIRRTLIMGVALGAFIVLVGLSYASVGQDHIRNLVESMPPAIQAFLQGADIASASGFLGVGFSHPITLAIMATTAITAGAAAARDVEHGVAELFLSRPLRRTAWVGANMIAMEISLAVVALLGMTGAFIAVGTIQDLDTVSYAAVAITTLVMFLLFSAIGAVTTLAASFSRTASRAVGIGVAFALVSYALNYLSQIWSALEPLGPMSVLHWYRPADILSNGAAALSVWLVLAGVTAGAATLALLVTSRREVAP